MGIIYKDRFEFPEKKFYWCTKANDWNFEPFPALNDYHKAEYDSLANKQFKGSHLFVHKQV